MNDLKDDNKVNESQASKFRKFITPIKLDSLNDQMGFILFLFFITIIYISNRHFAESNIKKIDRTSKEIKDLRAEYFTVKSKLMYLSKQTELAKKLETVGIKESVVPPIKITIEEE